MACRKGMGKGTGKKGYYNLIPKDKKVHSDSAKGRKQPQKVNYIPYANKKKDERLNPLNPDDIDILKEYAGDAFNEVLNETYEIESVNEEPNYLLIQSENGEFELYKDDGELDDEARESAENQLETDESLQSSFRDAVYVSETDKRIIAGEEADLYEAEMDDYEVVSEYGDLTTYEENQERIDELEDELEKVANSVQYSNEGKDEINNNNTDEIEKLESSQEDIVEEARETAREEKYNEWYDGLDDPIDFLVDEQGIYSKEDIFDVNFVQFDTEEAIEQWMQDGAESIMGGNFKYLSDGRIMRER